MKFWGIYVLSGLSVIVCLFLQSIIERVAHRQEDEMDKNDFVMYRPKGTAWLYGAICILFLILLAVAIAVRGFNDVAITLAGLVLPACLIFILAAYGILKERIAVQGDTITVTPVFGPTKTYSFADITKLKETSMGWGMLNYGVYTYKKRFSVTTSHIGYRLFMQRIAEAQIKVENRKL